MKKTNETEIKKERIWNQKMKEVKEKKWNEEKLCKKKERKTNEIGEWNWKKE